MQLSKFSSVYRPFQLVSLTGQGCSDYQADFGSLNLEKSDSVDRMRVHTKIVALHKMYPEEVGRAVRAWSSTDTLHNHRKKS